MIFSLITIGLGVVLPDSSGGFAPVSDDTSAKTESAWADKIDSDWGGHAKIRGGGSWPSADSLYGLAGGGTYLDGSAEGRLKSELYFGEFSKFETHYEIIWSGGETRENIRELERMFPALTGEFFIRNRIPNDDRRLFDLTSVISDKDDYVLYHRIDRLVLTLKPN